MRRAKLIPPLLFCQSHNPIERSKMAATRYFISLLQRRCIQTSAASLCSNSSPLSTNSSSSLSSSSSFTVQFLVNSCGLPLKSALSVSKKFQIHEKELHKSLSVLEFLKAHDFNETQIGRLIEKWPRVLLCRVESTLKLKFDFLTQNGFAGQILPPLIVLVPAILNRKVDSCIKPCFEFLKSFLDNNEKLLAAIKRYPWYFTFNFNSALKPNTVFLIKEGVPHDRVAKLILMYPRTLQMKPDRMVRVVNSVKNLGLEPKAPVFVHALRVMIGMSESTWKRKIEYMKSLGWTEDEVLLTFKRNPDILACSENKIGRAMDFFVNTVRLGSQTVVANPVLLQYSIDKRVRPRYNVLKVLESKNLIEVNQRVFWLLTTRSEMKFRENYVAKYADKVPGLLEIYRGTVEAKKIDT